MRLHQLEITGFGPFAETTRIDFDALSEAGLFLLSGPTGAGKSSVLDAVCFALYGDVPGDRSTAKRLRSDHAADDVVPRVVLEATMSGRRFRIDRSPAWQRPKKRGTGLTTEQARVVISERRVGEGRGQWLPLSTRLDETGHLVTRLLGMNLPQFCQVAMLPQGRFQAFLRATSQERHALLQQVFQTGRFDQVERWLRERRVTLRRASETHHAAVADLVSRVSEVTAAAAPEEWDDEPASLLRWTGTLTSASSQRCAEAAVQADDAAALEASAETALKAGIALAGLIAAHDDATRSVRALEAARAVHDDNVIRLEAARRSAGVRPLHEIAATARDRETTAGAAARSAGQALASLVEADVDPTDAARVEDQRAEAARVLTEVARVRPLQSEAESVQRELSAALASVDDSRSDLASVVGRIARLPGELAAGQARRDVAVRAAARVETLQQSVASWTARLDAAHAAETLSESLTQAEAARRTIVEERLLARETLVEIRERRLDGMVAEIAGQLAVGACCPVCGSAEHPSPAMASSGAADESAERTARKQVDDLEVVVEAHTQQVRGLEMQLATVLATAAGRVDELSDSLGQLTTDLADAREQAKGADQLAATVLRLQGDQSRLHAERDLLATVVSQHETSVAVLSARLSALRHDVSVLLAAQDRDDLESLAVHARQVEGAATRCLEALAELRRSRVACEQSAEQAQSAAREAGFDTADQAAGAWLAPHVVSELEVEIRHHVRELQRAQDTLADPEVARAGDAAPPDLEALARNHQDAKAACGAALRGHAGLLERVERLDGLVRDLDSALGEWAPLRTELEQVSDLAAFVEGKHPDNRLQMRLSAYVLAHRLGQVVRAANLRLASMSDQRYSLVHTGQRGAGETRGGLSLLVSDDWSGESRDPATLSGGETFVVSLALALGLADVITQESGGADLDTLFVDEGFGALDADTLEDVMDTLDALRDGGRVVGVVSHVPELQTRIPTQLRVHKARHGSRTTVRLG